MDLIYMNENKEDVGVLKDYTFDLAFGSDENNFECKIVSNNHCLKENYYLYIEGSEYGGIVDSIEVDTSEKEITYKGRTWHGILASKILCPDSGMDYLIVSGEANAVIALLLARMGLESLFQASSEPSGINISSIRINRYINGYEGIKQVLKSANAKLNISFKEGFVVLTARPLVNYANDEQFDTDFIDFTIEKNFNPINHCICLGKGDLRAREVIHLYADSSGNIGEIQTITGIREVVSVYDYPNAESRDELIEGGMEIIQKSWNSNSVELNFNSNDESYDIGDIVGAKEKITGIEAANEITKKIVTIKNNETQITYKVGE